jgi:serine/threonine-protein kinase
VSTIPEQIGRYKIIERLGAGGMGVLYRGTDPVLDRDVAIKVMLAGIGEGDQMFARFYREARAVAKLQHRNVVTVFEFGDEGGTPYIVMEYLRGTNLAVRLATPPPLTFDAKLDIVTQLCAGLGYAHAQGVVHRDVKPANTFLLDDGSVKLLDFGVAKIMDSNLTRLGDTLGTMFYMSPEQVAGSEAIDARADVFSVGTMLYEMLAGRRPFDDPSPTAILMKILEQDPPPLKTVAPGVPDTIVAIVNRALAKDPARRFSSGAELERELTRARHEAATVKAPAAVPFADPSAAPTIMSGALGAAPVTADRTIVTGPSSTASASTVGPSAPWTTMVETDGAAAASPAARPATAPAATDGRQAASAPHVRTSAQPSRRATWLVAAIVAALVVAAGAIAVARWGRTASNDSAVKEPSPPASVPSPTAAPPPPPPASTPAAPDVPTVVIQAPETPKKAPGASGPDRTAGVPPPGAQPGKTPPTPEMAAKCARLLERASLGETLTPGDFQFLNKNCK